MKFTAKRKFRHGHTTFEADNTYSSDVQGLTDEEVRSFHAAGWAEVEGMGPAPEPDIRRARLQPQSTAHSSKAKGV